MSASSICQGMGKASINESSGYGVSLIFTVTSASWHVNISICSYQGHLASPASWLDKFSVFCCVPFAYAGTKQNTPNLPQMAALRNTKMKIEDYLEKFGYTELWLSSGILDIEMFEKQIEDHIKTGHDCFEHYRYGTFSSWVTGRESATNQEVLNFLKLALEDSDSLMGGSAITHNLLKAKWLTDQQFELISNEINGISDFFTNEISKAKLSRDIEASFYSDEIFNECLKSENMGLQHVLLEHPDTNRNRMLIISEKGSSKKIRNIAKQKINTKKLWNT